MSKTFETTSQRASYGVGRQLGDQIMANPFDGVDAEAVAAGVLDSLEGKESAVALEDIRSAFGEIEAQMKAKQEEESKEFIVQGEEFLAENAKKDGVTVLESGLQYEVVNQGTGDIPLASSKVRTHYHGTLIDGSVFDSSVQRGEPAEFPVNGVIAGWVEALQLMPVGSKWKLYIPHDLAYGDRGAGGSIAPYSTLVFEIELLEIVS